MARYSADHFRNRLTHTIEVAQIALTVAGALELNTELAEALALVHDIGHPPVGHAGERRLDLLLRPLGGSFDHNLHALRIVEQFEHRYLDFPGLNLTFEVREGIIKHSRDFRTDDAKEGDANSAAPGANAAELNNDAHAHNDAYDDAGLAEYDLDLYPPLEAQLMDAVDAIAYNIADLDDGFEARLLDVPMLQDELPAFAEAYAAIERTHPRALTQLKFNAAIKHILDVLATDLIEHTRSQVLASGAADSSTKSAARRAASPVSAPPPRSSTWR